MRRVVLFLAACVAGASAAGLWAQEADSVVPAINPPAASQPVPRLIMFSGTVKDLTGKPLTGPVDLNFAIYKEQADAAPLWQESQTLNVDEQGHYTALLGAMQPEGLPVDLFTSGEARWLGVSADKLPEQPRVLLVSVPYALKANDAEMLAGKPASAYALAQPAGASTSAGTATAGTTGPGGAATSELATPGKPKSGAKPNVTGTGTRYYIPLWTDTLGTVLGNSVIYQSSGLVGIGTTTPGGRLDVAGSVGHFLVDTSGAQFRFTRGGANYFLAATAGGYFDFVANGLTPSDANASLKLAANGVVNFMAGNVGIGTLAPAQKLDVAGNIHSSGSVTAASFSGNGSGLTSLNASKLGSGTVPTTALSGTYPITISGNAASATNAANSVELGGVAAASFARLDVGNSFTGNQTVTTGTFGVGIAAPAGYVTGFEQADSTENSNYGNALFGLAENASGTKPLNEGADIEASVIGSGTVSENNALYVFATQAGAGTISQNQGIYIEQASAGTGTIGTNVGLQIADQTAGSVNYSILTGQGPVSFGDKLGIGTTAPAHMLDVVGDINASTNIHAGGNLSVTGTITGNGSGLTNVTASTATTASGLTCTGCVGNTQLGVNYATSTSKGGAASNALLLNGNASSAFQPAGSYAVTTGPNSFTGNQTVTGGSVGIGTTGPVSALNVAGTTGLTWTNGRNNLGLATLGTPATGGSLYINTPSANSSYQSGLGIDGTYGTPSLQSVINIRALGVHSGGAYGSQLAFWTTNGTALNQQMTIDKAGNVGIGTTTPAKPLQVASGDVYASKAGSGVIVKSPDGTKCARIGIGNDGNLSVTALACP